jgi:CRP-like cAMP-binding protein
VGISAADLAAIISRGESHSYKAGDYLYHESTPRLWMGIVEEGEIEIVRGLHGSSVRLATLTPGTGFSEGVMPGTEPWPFGDLKIVLKMAPIFSLDPATGNMRAELLPNSTFTFTGLTFAKAEPDLRREEDPRFGDFSRCSC